MESPKNSKYGNWPSPVSSALTVSGVLQLDELRCHADETWWLERQPEQAGRVNIVRYAQGTHHACLPDHLSCRSRVHEYGGGSYCVSDEGVYFVNDHDQDIYYLSHNNSLRRITSSDQSRYADMANDAGRNRLICIHEQHSDNAETKNSLLAVNIYEGTGLVLASGYDFYASPRLSPDGSQLAWLCWNHPDMPWDATELWLADVNADGELTASRRIAGGAGTSVFQPEWSAANVLYFVADGTGWWNLYCYQDQSSQILYQSEQEFGLPQWVFGQRCYSFIDQHKILCSFIDKGLNQLGILDIKNSVLSIVETGYNSFSAISAGLDYACFIAAADDAPPAVIKLDFATGKTRALRSSSGTNIDARYFSRPAAIEFNTRHGDTAHAIYYPACNPEINTSPEQKPPLIVITHGGPTTRNDAAFDLRKQFWTSRGYALLDVNYSGSTGYGRAYRERLRGNWGLRDAEDCCDAALYMVAAGLVDPQRLIIKGGSAGGYTVLCALTFHNVFAAGASYYGISELEALAQHTHKFEAHYLDGLIGPYPEMRALYKQRSPLNHVEQLKCPVIFFQGLNDKVVPSEQAEMMFSALRNKGVATSYLSFPGEAHGFRKAETLIACLRAELEFYARVLNLPLAAECEGKLTIENLAP